MIFDKLSTVIGLIKILIYKLIFFKRLKLSGIIKIKSNFNFIIDKKSRILIGNKVRIRSHISLKAEQGGKIIIGDGVFINDNCTINALDTIKIGNNVLIGHNFLALDHDHDYKKDIRNFIKKEITIGNNVWIGANVTILKGVKIGNNSVIAANTIVNKDIEDNVIVYNEIKRITKKIPKKD